MQCPQGDGELIAHTAQGENNLTVSYSTCPTCHGHWMDSFAANFIRISLRDHAGDSKIKDVKRTCPICAKTLVRATGNAIPDEVTVYTCPDHHGYFFPTGQLAAFKSAQHAKLAYHKLWNIPLPSVASVLLAGFLVLILTGGFLATYQGLRTQQTTVSQARDILVAHHAYVVRGTGSVLITADTNVDASLTLILPELHNYSSPMMKPEDHLYTTTLKNVPPGTYTYYFVIEVGGTSVRSESFSFTMP